MGKYDGPCMGKDPDEVDGVERNTGGGIDLQEIASFATIPLAFVGAAVGGSYYGPKGCIIGAAAGFFAPLICLAGGHLLYELGSDVYDSISKRMRDKENRE